MSDDFVAHTREDGEVYGVQRLVEEKEDLQNTITNMLNDFNRRWGGKLEVERIHVDLISNVIGAGIPFEHVVSIDLRL